MSTSPHPLEKELEMAVQLARWAGRAQRDAGRASATFIAQELRRAAEIRIRESFPDDVVVSDPHAPSEGRSGAGRVWFVDPHYGVDGRSDAPGGPCVLIGLAVSGRSVLGVIHRPLLGETYRAVLGGGAWFEDERGARRLRVVERGEPAHLQAMGSHDGRYEGVARSIGASFDDGPLQLATAPALCAALIATHPSDVALHAGGDLTEIDTCAAEVIVLEAGGCMSDLMGNPLVYNKDDMRHARGVLVRGPLVGSEVTKVVRRTLAA